MLALDSDVWTGLQDAYGNAAGIPGLLRQLEQAPYPRQTPTDEPWQGLWSALCHQGDVYTASYAASPHLVRIGSETTGPIDFSFFLLPASIEIARQPGHGHALPDALSNAYHAGLQGLTLCAYHHAADAWNRDMTRSVMAALAAAKGDIDLAEVLLELDDDRVIRFLADINQG